MKKNNFLLKWVKKEIVIKEKQETNEFMDNFKSILEYPKEKIKDLEYNAIRLEKMNAILEELKSKQQKKAQETKIGIIVFLLTIGIDFLLTLTPFFSIKLALITLFLHCFAFFLI